MTHFIHIIYIYTVYIYLLAFNCMFRAGNLPHVTLLFTLHFGIPFSYIHIYIFIFHVFCRYSSLVFSPSQFFSLHISMPFLLMVPLSTIIFTVKLTRIEFRYTFHTYCTILYISWHFLWFIYHHYPLLFFTPVYYIQIYHISPP